MHDLRVGSIMSVRILFLGYIGDIILGLCVGTSIIAESFCPLKTVYVCAYFFFSSMFVLYECSKCMAAFGSHSWSCPDLLYTFQLIILIIVGCISLD
ncbi:unnamed protein product [Trifolium pratense]|uniref:Uncharacterized protein n=1 Tax=Trifolium pratense TaxID=57577 RepID=A0ACB0K100_TRIPR|nr:unnamed protein product [Trifolium pratense]